MAKKYKRSTSPAAPTKPETAVTTVAEKATPAFTRRAGSGDFNPDYSYVIKDLKRIGTLAGSFFVILIILSFFLNR